MVDKYENVTKHFQHVRTKKSLAEKNLTFFARLSDLRCSKIIEWTEETRPVPKKHSKIPKYRIFRAKVQKSRAALDSRVVPAYTAGLEGAVERRWSKFRIFGISISACLGNNFAPAHTIFNYCSQLLGNFSFFEQKKFLSQ